MRTEILINSKPKGNTFWVIRKAEFITIVIQEKILINKFNKEWFYVDIEKKQVIVCYIDPTVSVKLLLKHG